MSDHIGSLMDAYLDNELSLSRVNDIEVHLASCAQCQKELKQRRQLVALLKEAPPVPAIQSKGQFISNIHLQLTPKPNKSWTYQRVLKLGWQAIPVGLLLVIAFIQTVSFLGTVTQFIPGGSDVLLGSLTEIPVEFTTSDLLRTVFSLLGVFRLPDWTWVTGIAATFIIGITYISWMVIWWGQHQTANNRRMSV